MRTTISQAIMLWTLDLTGRETPAAAWLALLDREELAQSQRFVRAKDRLAYAAAHALLRRALGQTLGISPGSVMMARAANGKPFLAAPRQNEFEFSPSHTEGMVAADETGAARRRRLWREHPSPRHGLALAASEDGTVTRMAALL